MSCIDCKPNILNKQSSIIAAPSCNDCDELEVDCGGDYIWTDCVKSNVALSCIETAIGATQTSINQALDTKLCQVLDGTVKVSVSEPDTCPGYLEDKITAGDGITITKEENVSGCQHLVVSEKCWEWNNVIKGTGDGKFGSGWNNLDTSFTIYQRVQYSNEKECSIRLRGSAYYSQPGQFFPTIFTLPVNKRPSLVRVFSVNVLSSQSPSLDLPCLLYIFPTGEVQLQFKFNTSITNITVSLDGIQFELN